MFVVDDLVGWLIGRLADAGYQKLVTLLRGSDQARALKAAVTAAVEATVGEIGPSGADDAERVAGQINGAFRRGEPVPLLPGQATLLEALQAGIAGQLSALDGAGQSAADLGAPVSEVAAKLTGHLVRQIQIRGSQPGPLTPLAGQLNDDLTHLQGQRIEGMLAKVLDLLGDGLARPAGPAGSAGQPLAGVSDPFALEVHRPVEPDVPRLGLSALPVYVPRDHDAALAEVTSAAAAGTSGIAVLVGGSSTGKTRACWQALELLRGVGPEWWLWHPVDSQAALVQLPGAGPRTVVWLNEAQRHLRPDDAGERVAAGLRELLRDRARGPVLVLATLWPEYWDQLTARPPGGADPHAQARELLSGHDIPVPDAFTDEQLRQLQGADDPRLAQAAAGSRDGQVIQYLAGAPALVARYRYAPPAARALIDAAMDARRLGVGPALPQAFLQSAAPGYMTDTEWNQLPHDWLEQALNYTAERVQGATAPLTRLRPRPSPDVPDSPTGGSAWQLADYLDQQGRRTRREKMPPEAFWAAAASHADPADLVTVAKAATDRGLYRTAAMLNKQASAHGNPTAGANLVYALHRLHPGDQRPADWATDHASLDDLRAVAALLRVLHEAGAAGQAAALASRAAAHAPLDDPDAVASLMEYLSRVGAAGQVTALLDRDPAAQVSPDNPHAVTDLLRVLHEAGAAGQVTALASRAAAHASLDHPHAVAMLLDALRQAGAAGQLAVLLDRDPAAQVSLDNPHHMEKLLSELYWAGAAGQVTALASRAAARVSLDDPHSVAEALILLSQARAAEQITELLDRDPAAQVGLDDPDGVASLLSALAFVGATGQVTALASRAAAWVSLDDPHAVAALLDALRRAGAAGQITELLDRDPAAQVSLDDPHAVAALLDALRRAGAAGQVTALLDRDPAAQVSVDDPGAVAPLLYLMHWVGAAGQATTLASRAAARVSLGGHPLGVSNLIRVLSGVGAAGKLSGQLTALLDRDPAAQVSLDDLDSVAGLLSALFRAGAAGQVTALASRIVAHANLDDDGVESLLIALYEAGTRAQAAELVERLPAAGQFRIFCAKDGRPVQFPLGPDTARAEQFRFGRETDGHPAKPWGWTDISA